jgi:protein O-mannosyl-transferase
MQNVDLAPRLRRLIAVLGPAAIIVAAVALAYANSGRGPFVYDDIAAITENASIRRLGAATWLPPPGTTVAGRPVVNATLAINYALGGDAPFGYHVFNAGIHALAALVLFGVVGRTLASARMRPRFEPGVQTTALITASVWALHPLQTEAVTYVVQRAESLVTLCYLFTLYALIRTVGCAQTARRRAAGGWEIAAVVACGVGMATKEVMATAPVLVLAYDRLFLASSFRELWRNRRRMYVGLGLTWLVLFMVVQSAGDRAGTAGFSAGADPLRYAASQAGAILHYLRLIAWPNPLVFDYGPFVAAPWRSALLPIAALVGLLGLAGWAFRRAPAGAFAVAAFFVVLAPTSSLLPIVTEPMAEHRLYLPSAALIALAVAGTYRLGKSRAIVALACAAVVFGTLTARRNRVYRSERELWTATVAARPGNPRAHYCRALTLLSEGERAAGEAELRQALALAPKYVAARHRLAQLLTEAGRNAEAAAELQVILRDHPDDFVAHSGLGLLAFHAGEVSAAAEHFREALRAQPNSAVAHNNLGGALYELGRYSETATECEAALRIDPTYAEAAYNLANALARQGDASAARVRYEQALRLRSDYPEAHANLGAVLVQLGDRTDAIEHFREALRLRPDFEFARQNLARLTGGR